MVDVSPVPPLQLTELCARLFDEAIPPQLRASAGSRALEVLSQKVLDARPELEVMVARVLGTMLAEFGPLWAKDGRLDPKRVTALPVAGQLPV